MIRSGLIVLGIGGIAYGLYNYFSKQLELALKWDFKIKDLKVVNIDANGAELNLLVSVLNKSSFNIEVRTYDIDVFYKNIKIANAKSFSPFTVQAESWFDVPTKAFLDFKGSKGILDDFAIDVLKNNPIDLDVKGVMKVTFGNINRNVIFNVPNVRVTEGVSTSLGISKPVGKITDFITNLGIKI
jgi:LEA14-like dessication related protein